MASNVPFQPSFLPDDPAADAAGEIAIDPSFVDSSRLGRYAEFMVCAELTRLGYHVLHVDAPGFDVIMAVNGSSLRVQVKSTATIKHPPTPHPSGRGRKARPSAVCFWNCTTHTRPAKGVNFGRTNRHLTKEDADLVALFHLEYRTTVFIPVSAVPKSGTVTLPLPQVQQHNSKMSLESALKSLGFESE